MVTNFETETAPLSNDELKLMDVVMSGMKHRTAQNPIISREITKAINARLSDYGVKQKMTDARLRKIINHIRSNGMQPIMGTSEGYFVSYDPEEIRRQVQSLRDRVGAIESAARGLESFLKSADDLTQSFIQAELFKFETLQHGSK